MFDALGGFVVVRLHPTPMRPCLGVTIWDASLRCRLLRAYLSHFSLHAMIMLTMLVCVTCWLSMHLYMSAYMSHAMLTIFILLVCFVPFCTLSTHLFLSIACLLVSYLCLYVYGARTLGARAWSSRHKQKGRGVKHVDLSQAAMFSRFRSLIYSSWLCTLLNPLPFSFLSLLDGLS